MDWLVKQGVATDDDRHTILAKKKNETSYNHFYDIIHRIPEDEFERFINRSCFNEGPKKLKKTIIQNTVPEINKANNVGLMASTILLQAIKTYLDKAHGKLPTDFLFTSIGPTEYREEQWTKARNATNGLATTVNNPFIEKDTDHSSIQVKNL